MYRICWHISAIISIIYIVKSIIAIKRNDNQCFDYVIKMNISIFVMRMFYSLMK